MSIQKIKALPSNLVAAWVEVAAHRKGITVKKAVDTLNVALGTHHQDYRIRKWRRGDEHVPDHVQAYMRRVILHEVFGPKTADALAEVMLTEHTRVHGS